MSLLFCDGFDHYTTADIGKKWNSAGINTISSFAGRRSAGAMAHDINNSSGAGAVKNFTPKSTIIVGVAVKTTTLNIPNREFIGILDAGVQQLGLRTNADGTMSIGRATGASGQWTQLATIYAGLTVGAFVYVELKATIHNTAGAYEVRINGNVVASATAQNTRFSSNNQATGVRLGLDTYSGYGGSMTFDDFYLCDTAGTINNDFLGDVRIDTLYPNADGTYSQFVPDSGTVHFSRVNDAAPDVLTYNASDVVGNKDSYQFSDLAMNTGAIKGVQLSNAAFKTDAGTRSLANLVKSGPSEQQGVSTGLGTTLAYLTSVHETDPNGNVAWTPATVNAAEFGSVITA